MTWLSQKNKNFLQKLTQDFQILTGFVSVSKQKLQSKQSRYWLAISIDILCLAIILFNAPKPAQRIFSSLLDPFKSAYMHSQIQFTKESFSFIPGQAQNKYESIKLDGLNYLSFYDLPVTEEGINFNSRGYNSFKDQDTQDLISRAHSYNTKVLITLSQTDTDTIKQILNDQSIQNTLIDQAITEVKDSAIEGVNIDFEPTDLSEKSYQDKFTNFIKNLTLKLHQAQEGSQVAVVVPSNSLKTSTLYNLPVLGKSTDKIFILASDLIVPEINSSLGYENPEYGYHDQDYFKDLSDRLSSFGEFVNADKLVMERAWYGSGNDYPLYKPTSHPTNQSEVQPAFVSMDSRSIDRLAQGVPSKGRAAAKKNIPLIAKALKNEGILDSNVLAYALATIEHETDGTFEPIEEIQGRQSSRRYGYEGGSNYFGRGFIQLTHLRNYRMIGERIGMGDALARHPDLASNPEVAAKILAAFFKDNNIANLASKGYFLAARTPINPDYNGQLVAMLAQKYEEE